ncbi:unnamed protein product [Cuscuta campestris]|uniref:Uncharacterized protein n=1 Tax=Cuscuta campestris TaxID=132261 RepID=A0A484NR22_9ASTE|nr:unnamed protein product [Cuscuta campestris]
MANLKGPPPGPGGQPPNPMNLNPPPPNFMAFEVIDNTLPAQLGFRTPWMYRCPLSLTPWQLPQQSQPQPNPLISQDFDDWIYKSNHPLWEVPSMMDWSTGMVTNQDIPMCMTPYYRDGLRTILSHVYKESVIEGLHRVNLGLLIRRNGDGLEIDTTDPPSKIVKTDQVLDTIHTLKLLVERIVESVPLTPPAVWPDEVTCFYDLCDFAEEPYMDQAFLRDFLLFVCKNPLIFDTGDALRWFWKTASLDQMYRLQDIMNYDDIFEHFMNRMRGFISGINASAGPFYDLKMYLSQRMSHSLPPQYTQATEVIRYMGNAIRHIRDRRPYYTYPGWFPLSAGWETYGKFMDQGNTFCQYFRGR